MERRKEWRLWYGDRTDRNGEVMNQCIAWIAGDLPDFLGLRLSFSFIPVFSVAVLWASLSIRQVHFWNFCFPFLVRACILISDYRLSHMTDPERGTDMVSVNEWRARKMNTEERSYDAVILDLDGTLLDTLTDPNPRQSECSVAVA